MIKSNEKAFNEFLKGNGIYKEFYSVFTSPKARRWRWQCGYGVSKAEFFNEHWTSGYVSGAFPWHIGQRHWRNYSMKWGWHVQRKHTSKYFKVTLNNNIHIL